MAPVCCRAANRRQTQTWLVRAGLSCPAHAFGAGQESTVVIGTGGYADDHDPRRAYLLSQIRSVRGIASPNPKK